MCHLLSESVDGIFYYCMNLLIILLFLFNASHSEGVNESFASLKFMDVKGVELELEGLVICDENGDKTHDVKLKNQLTKDPTVQDVVKVLGPGYLSPISGTGGINWYFSDGSKLTTILWPKTLHTKVKLISPE